MIENIVLGLLAIMFVVLAVWFWGDGELVVAGSCALVPLAVVAFMVWRQRPHI